MEGLVIGFLSMALLVYVTKLTLEMKKNKKLESEKEQLLEVISDLKEEHVDFNRNKLSPITILIDALSIDNDKVNQKIPKLISEAKRAVNNLAYREVYKK